MTARSRASFGRTVGIGLAGAAVALVASNSVWAKRASGASAPSVSGTTDLAGSDLVPLVVPLTLVALACWGAVLVLRRRGRRVVTVIGAIAAATAAVLTVVRVAGTDDLDTTGWPWVVAAAEAVTALALVLAWSAAPGWPEMSTRYDGRASQQPRDEAADPGRAQSPAELWRALDEGRDPTA